MNRPYTFNLANVSEPQRFLLDAVVAVVADPDQAGLCQRVLTGQVAIVLDQDKARFVCTPILAVPSFAN